MTTIPQPKFSLGQTVKRTDGIDHVGPVTFIEISITKKRTTVGYYFLRAGCHSCGNEKISFGFENDLEAVTDLPVKFIGSESKPKNQISGNFVRRVQSAGCQCGKQKLEGKPLCGVCFSRLPDELKNLLRFKRGGELEQVYEQACNHLQRRRK